MCKLFTDHLFNHTFQVGGKIDCTLIALSTSFELIVVRNVNSQHKFIFNCCYLQVSTKILPEDFVWFANTFDNNFNHSYNSRMYKA